MTEKPKNFPLEIYGICPKCDGIITIKISVVEHDCIKIKKKT